MRKKSHLCRNKKIFANQNLLRVIFILFLYKININDIENKWLFIYFLANKRLTHKM
jgi:hypothetical protein